MVNLFDFDEVDDRYGDVDIDRDVEVLHFVKAERCNLLVVIVLVFKEFWVWREIEGLGSPTFMKRSLQLSSSDSSRQFDVWSHLVDKRSFQNLRTKQKMDVQGCAPTSDTSLLVSLSCDSLTFDHTPCDMLPS